MHCYEVSTEKEMYSNVLKLEGALKQWREGC